MVFASIFVPNFILQAVVRAEPALRERALALIDGNPPLCSVVAVNERAARAGVEPGMTKLNAAQFAGLEMRPRLRPQEKIAHDVLLDIGWSVSPRIEDTSQDSVVLDLAGLTHLFGSENNIGAHLVQRSCECGLLSNVAIAANVDTALIAARGFSGVTVIPPGRESASLGDLPVSVLFPSPETMETLNRWGVRTCAAFAALPVLQLSERLGQEGVRLHALARGAIARAIVIAEPGRFFEEEMELDDAVEELDPLSFLLGRLLDQLCARLAARSLAAASIRVCFELQPAFENALDVRKELFRRIDPPGVYERELQLPVPARDSKMLLKLLRLRLQANPPGAPIRKIVLAAESARPRAVQGGLFLPSFPDPEKLELTIARIAGVVGEGNVGSPSLVDTYRPGEFQMRRFLAPLDGAEPRRGRDRGHDAAAHPREQHENAKSRTSFRIFRPPIPATLELRAGCPTRVNFQGLRGEVLSASGPWRTSGDWWRDDPWQQDEWDLEIRFHSFPANDARDPAAPAAAALRSDCGLYRFYYDALRQSWFVRGIYD
jgi:protein ImuB